jgi:hypothetical protein
MVMAMPPHPAWPRTGGKGITGNQQQNSSHQNSLHGIPPEWLDALQLWNPSGKVQICTTPCTPAPFQLV